MRNSHKNVYYRFVSTHDFLLLLFRATRHEKKSLDWHSITVFNWIVTKLLLHHSGHKVWIWWSLVLGGMELKHLWNCLCIRTTEFENHPNHPVRLDKQLSQAMLTLTCPLTFHCPCPSIDAWESKHIIDQSMSNTIPLGGNMPLSNMLALIFL